MFGSLFFITIRLMCQRGLVSSARFSLKFSGFCPLWRLLSSGERNRCCSAREKTLAYRLLNKTDNKCGTQIAHNLSQI